MTEHHCLVKIPLNYSQEIDQVVFFHGLDWFGAVVSNLTSYNPVLTRQLFYYYPDLQKAFYLFIPLAEAEKKKIKELRAKIFHVVDSYLFAYNCIHPECQSNARGKGMLLHRDDSKKHINSDGGRVWIHDPFQYAFEGKPRGYIHKKTDEECTSGRYLIEEKWKKFERDLESLINSYVVINEKILNDYNAASRGSDKSVCNSDYPVLFKKDHLKSINDVKQCIHSFADFAQQGQGWQEKYGWALDEVTIYDPVRFDQSKFFHIKHILNLEQTAIQAMFPYKVEKSNPMTSFFTDLNCKQLLEFMRYDKRNLSFEIVKAQNLYDPGRLGYFFSALNGDRPYSQFLDFYRLLEAEFRESGIGEDSSKLINLLNSKNRFPDNVVKHSFSEASKAGQTSIVGFKGNAGKWKRELISNAIYQIRRRLAHSKLYKEEPPIKPLTDDERNAELDFWVVFVRELARHLILSSIETSEDSDGKIGDHMN